MKYLWLSVVATALFLVGCAPDRTLETLVPRTALAVVLVDHPGQLSPVIGAEFSDLPWQSLDGSKPWAAAAVPANPPGILLAVALNPGDAAWSGVSTWARDRGGMVATKLGTYAVLTSPGLPTPVAMNPEACFDFRRIRTPGDAVAIYLDVKNLEADKSEAPVLQRLSAASPWAVKNLAGIRMGLNALDSGLVVRFATDWAADSPVGPALRSLGRSEVDPSSWTGYLSPGPGFGLAASLSPQTWAFLGVGISDLPLKHRWAALASLLGPRVAFSVRNLPDGTAAWGGVVESRDPQGVRQALKTLVASGELQRSFPGWAGGTGFPVVYQDRPDGTGGIKTRVVFGKQEVFLGYGTGKVVFASGHFAGTDLYRWLQDPGVPAPWAKAAPSTAFVVATGTSDGLGARSSLGILGDGNVELRFWVDAAGLKTWEERLPQALLSWVSGTGGWTRWEP